MRKIIVILTIAILILGCRVAGAEPETLFVASKQSALYKCSIKDADNSTFHIFVSYQADSGEVTAWDFWMFLEIESEFAAMMIEFLSRNSIFQQDYAGVYTFIGSSKEQKNLIMKYTFILQEIDYEALAKSDDNYVKMILTTAGYNSTAVLRLLQNTGYSCSHSDGQSFIKMTTLVE